MKNIERYLLISLFSGYVIKVLATSASISDAAIVLFLAASYFLYNSQIQNKEISQLKQELTTTSEQIKKLQKDSEDMRNAVAGVKITQGLRNIK